MYNTPKNTTVFSPGIADDLRLKLIVDFYAEASLSKDRI